MDSDGGEIIYNYRFILEEGKQKEFNLRLDPSTLDLISEGSKRYPAWTALEFFKCPNCPLDPAAAKHCPIAVNIVEPISFFSSSVSYEEAEVVVWTQDRTYLKQTSLQEGLGSMVGIYMVTSGCPVMEKLKPMVRFHLPFASEDETKYRVLSMYMLAQFFMHRNGDEPDWELKRLLEIYEDVRQVNMGFSQRLSNIHIKDASINALINLDCLAMSLTFSLSKNTLQEIEQLFKAYLR